MIMPSAATSPALMKLNSSLSQSRLPVAAW